MLLYTKVKILCIELFAITFSYNSDAAHFQHHLLNDAKDVKSDTQQKAVIQPPPHIPDIYKVIVIFENSPLDDQAVDTFIETISNHLNLPVANVHIIDRGPNSLEFYITYQDADGSELLIPASQLELMIPAVSPLPVKHLLFKPLVVMASTASSKRNNEVTFWTLFCDIWASWQIPLLVCSSLIFIFVSIILAMFFWSRRDIKSNAEVPHQVIYQSIHKPPLPLTPVQPDTKMVVDTDSEPTSSPSRSPLHHKAKRLLERRGSNASLTLDLNRSQDSLPCTSPTKTNSSQEFLLSLGNRMSRKELRSSLKDVKSLHTEFWEIPMNHPEKVEIPGCGTKNRYKTIMPNEHSRVHLLDSEAEENENPLDSYINANYVKGYDGEAKAYIATQGPMSHTVNDFWWMIWKEGSPVVVMITRLKEKNKVKCECYIPEYMASYGVIDVTVLKVIPRDGYTIRELKLQCRGNQKYVRHFWFTSWPDHNTPNSIRPLLAMASEVEMSRRHANGVIRGPTIVHCSAGIGRTGCFIATNIGMQQLKEENNVDVLGIVCNLRVDRGGMVQTAEQYEFVHHILHLYERTLPLRLVESPPH